MRSGVLHTGSEVGGYTIEGRIGEGAFAEVFLGRHRTRGTRHAIKVLRVTTRAMRERMLREGRLQAGVRHPNVVGVTEVLELDLGPVLVVDYVEGGPLSGLLSRRALTLAEAHELGRGVLTGVAAAHA